MSSIFPAIQPTVAAETQTLPMCKEVAWDYTENRPVFSQGEPVVVTGKEAVKVWIHKALLTPRLRHEIYSQAFGAEFENMIGQSFSVSLKKAEASRYLRECLLVNPYVSSVDGISVDVVDDSLMITGTAQTIYGEVEINAAA